ncbi:uncharacterized protein LOC132889959 [Neoarius graeffei]|uniref:uncharacterized protein LOC132889959 n=1 Tax=Neoarius graeffei TaxID=443677 RepID=UPI00298D343B|nr:uncharacterized protein LOC132889959 [Neoarius graeffei]
MAEGLDTGDGEGDQKDLPPHPWPYLKEFFEIVGSKNDSFQMQCKLCIPKTHVLLAFKNSPSNLKKHIERKHGNHLECYKALTSTALRRKAEGTPEQGPPAPKQSKLFNSRSVSQASVDKKILNFIVQGLHATNTVEQQGFKELIQHLQPNLNVMSRNTVVNKIQKMSLEMKNNLKAAMSKIDYIGTTTDCWTAYRRGFLGVTAHWIDPTTMTRRCAALACKQLNGPHTFSALASALNEVHCEFNIRDKITRTTTDNGSNFIKAFKLYGQTDENNNPGACFVEGGEGKDDGGESIDEELESEGMELIDAGAILDEAEDDTLEYQLPRHHRCACHLLNLVSTVDVEEANVNSAYKRVSRLAFSKCWGLWNKSARSTTAAEVIEKNCKLQLVRPNATRWNSMFLAVERIIRIKREQGEGAITAVCSALKIAMFTPVELAFLAEYTKTMAPVAKALDVLQGETNVQMGWLVPTITILKNKLQSLSISSKYCRPLIDALLKGLEKRFEQVLKEPELIAAAILVPKFKTGWTSDDCTLTLGLDYIKSHLKDQTEEDQVESSPSSSEEDFFSSIKQASSQENAKQLETYLGSPGDTMDALKSFPAICTLSLRLNTALPASAACDRLFSVAGLIFRPKRARIDHKNFENQLLLRLNRAFW